ncbi:MAG: hypothetical protein J5509_04845 [Lachnospiraceae bacterium]|nr:hypothetical protein [Lachnospiraceae bacterium]
MAPKEQYRKKTSQQIIEGLDKVKSVSSFVNIGNSLIADPEQKTDRVRARIMKRAEDNLPAITDINRPRLEDIADAQKKAGVRFMSIKQKRSRLVDRANAKFDRQQQLAVKHDLAFEYGREELNDNAAQLAEMDPAKLLYAEEGRSADETLIEHYSDLQGTFLAIDTLEAQLATEAEAGIEEEHAEEYAAKLAQLNTLKDIRSYYQVTDALMSNKYYAMLPRDHMLAKSYKELRERLDELYKAEERDESLIDYYQNLVRLKQLGITDSKSITDRKAQYLEKLTRAEDTDQRDGAKEMNKIATGYDELTKMLKKRADFYTDAEKKAYIHQFFVTHNDEIEKFRDQADLNNSSVADLITAFDEHMDDPYVEAQETSSLLVAANVKGDASKLEKRKDPSTGIAISPEQTRAIKKVGAYLMRRSCLDKKKKGAFVHHLLQAPPEQQLVVFYLLETGRQDSYMRSDFYSALAGYTPDLSAIKKKVKTGWFSSSPDWKMITNAVQAAKSLGADIQLYGELENNIALKKDEISNAGDDAAAKGQLILDQIANRYDLLALLYRNAGLRPEMSPDMVDDEKLRERMYSELGQIVQLSEQFRVLTLDNPDIAVAQREQAEDGTHDTYKEKEKSRLETANSVVSTANTYLNYPSTIHKSAGNWYKNDEGSSGKEFMEGNLMKSFGVGMGTLSAVFGIISNVYAITKLWGKTGLTVADKIAQWSTVGSGSVGTLTGGGTTAINFLKLVGTVSDETSGVKMAGDIFGYAGVVTGSIGAIASGIQLGRSISSGIDIGASRNKLNARKKLEGGLNPDEKTLERFLDHSKRDTARQITSKAVSTCRSIAGVAVSAVAIAPVIAPIGAVVGLASLAVGELARVIDRKTRNGIIKKAVDEQLDINGIIAKMKNDASVGQKIRRMKEDDLKDMVREEAVAQFGYSSYKSYFREVCREFAELLYRKVFEEPATEDNADEKQMYRDAMESLGTKIKEGVNGKPNQPSVKTMIAKLMG